MKTLNKSFVKKFIKFGGVGVLNTIIDYAVFNFCLSAFGMSPFYANFFSTSAALSFSYFANKSYVFKHGKGYDHRSALSFVLVTTFGLWIIQGLGLAMIVHLVQSNHAAFYASHEYLVINVSKLIASVASIVWNFIMYDTVVFKKRHNDAV